MPDWVGAADVVLDDVVPVDDFVVVEDVFVVDDDVVADDVVVVVVVETELEPLTPTQIASPMTRYWQFEPMAGLQA